MNHMRTTNAAVSLCVLAVLLAAPSPASCDGYEDSLAALLPASGEVGGWQRDGEYLIYYADELWEYIDGAAEGFLAYDVKAVIIQDYIDESAEGLKLEIYDHGAPLMAYGIYTQHRDPSLDFLAVGGEGFGDEYSLYFWKGPYFVQINAYAEGEDAVESMRLFARAVDGKMAGSTSSPMELEAFPSDGLIPRSEAFLTEGVLGRGRFPNAFVADYTLGGNDGELYLFPTGGGERAQEVFSWYAGEISADIIRLAAGEAPYERGDGTDPYQGEVTIFRFGSWLGVVTGFEDDPDARHGLVERCVKRIGVLADRETSP
jgi:hypothetical protein